MISQGGFSRQTLVQAMFEMRKKKKRRVFESKVTLEKSSAVFLYQFQISHDEHKQFRFGAE